METYIILLISGVLGAILGALAGLFVVLLMQGGILWRLGQNEGMLYDAAQMLNGRKGANTRQENAAREQEALGAAIAVITGSKDENERNAKLAQLALQYPDVAQKLGGKLMKQFGGAGKGKEDDIFGF